MPKTYTLSLSRWHKVAERLAREYTETVHKSKQVLTQTRVSAYLGESQEQTLRDAASNWNERMAHAFRLQDSIADIRRALGDRNVQSGVSGLLAEFDKLNRRQRMLSEIVDGQTADMIGIGELKNIRSDYLADGDGYDSRRPQLQVRMLDQADVRRLQQELDAVRARTYALADEIAELNKTTVLLELTEEAALAAGL